MKIKRLLLGALAAVMASGASIAQNYNVTKDEEGYPVMYIKGTMTNNWNAIEAYRFTRTGDNYTITLASLDGEFKISAKEWGFNYGAGSTIFKSTTVSASVNGANFVADNLKDVTISFTLGKDAYTNPNDITFTVPGGDDPDPLPGPATGMSGKLPVLYINVYTDTLKTTLNNEIISRNLDHKNYFSNAEYWLDVNDCQWLIDEGAASIGSKDAPLPLKIKARGNFTRQGFAKKPFKLKLGAEQSLLGLSKSEHFAILAHADDNYGYLRNFTGFWLGRAIGLPWTPWQQPVEVVINNNYRGLYFLTESIRIETDRVNITKLEDLVDDQALVSGGYLVELDNYNETNQIKMEEKSCAGGQRLDMLRITWDTPEEYSELQKRFVTEQFTAMNDAVGSANSSDELWRYMDMDDAARYYLVEEIISHWEAYHGSTYMFRDRGEGKKWHFSPLWDCGNAFNGATDKFFYNCDQFGNTWIPSMRENAAFNAKVRETWAWFMKNKYPGIEDDMRAYADHIKEAAKADRARWKDAPRPSISGARDVVDNTDMDSRLENALNHLNAKTAWLKTQFGEYADASEAEPARDNTEPAPLPDYVKPGFDPYETYPDMYIRGTMTGADWGINEAYKMTREGKTYTITLESLDGEFKVGNSDWTVNYGPETPVTVTGNKSLPVNKGGKNITASGLQNVTISFDLNLGADGVVQASTLVITVPEIPATGMSGKLPVLYINVYTDETKTEYNNEVIDKDLNHKNYFSNAEYWLDVNDCQWLIDEGAASIGSKDAPLPLKIKARGNFTRQGFAKKPFKLKLGAEQSLLGLSKSEHFAILAHADDNYGYLRNFTGFWLGRAIGLPWTPWQQPVEVVINNNYRGLYFLTESIRIETDRVNITKLEDLVDDQALVSGGYLVELDNYDEPNQISMEEKSCVYVPHIDRLRVTWDTPEDYSETQKRFVTEQFTAMNDAVGSANTSDELWRYMDMDDAARYYLVEEIISHYEAYHGSTYLFRDRGNGQKWHFSPLWDCGHAFDGATDRFLYNNDGSYGNTWIPSIRQNSKFNNKVKATWLWFMNNGYTGLKDAMTAYAGHIAEAAKADRARWKDAPLPVFPDGTPQPVVDNSDMQGRLAAAIAHLDAKTSWLKTQFGDYAVDPDASEPAKDTTEAAPLPSYANPNPDVPDDSVVMYYYDYHSWNEVYAYIWGGGDDVNDQMLGAWPGTKMKDELAGTMQMRPLVAAREVGFYSVKFTPSTELNEKHRVIFNNGNSGTGNETKSFQAKANYIYNDQGILTRIDGVSVDAADAAPEYYSLQGIRVAAPRRGEFYIRVFNGNATRIRY